MDFVLVICYNIIGDDMTREELNQKKQKDVENEVRRSKQKKIIWFFLKIVAILFILSEAFYLFNRYISTRKIIVKEERIVNNKIPSSFDGLKIVQFSDLHYGSTIFIDEVKNLVELINIRKPNIVVFTGDLVDEGYSLSSEEQESLIKELSKINADIGKYAIFGEDDGDSFMTIFNQSDFMILNNDYDLVYNDSNKPILIVGVSSSLQRLSDIDKAFSYFNNETYDSNIYTITLLHEPDLVDEINNRYKSDLFLAGHSHNNSIHYPWGGSPYKIEGALKYNEEYYEVGNSRLYISSGIGTDGYGIRLFCLPSINFFRLSSK